MKKLFEQGQRKFLRHTALSSIHRINIIEFLNKSEYEIKNLRITAAYEISYNKDQLMLPESKLKYFRFYRNKMYDMK